MTGFGMGIVFCLPGGLNTLKHLLLRLHVTDTGHIFGVPVVKKEVLLISLEMLTIWPATKDRG
jgi:hypothetical protein